MNKPKIFISWSGKNTASFRVASRLNDILPLMFQNADYFFSDHITKGKPGIDKIFCNLAEAKIGIFCVTKENILKPWLNFEAGAVASAVKNNNGLAIPLLINMNMDDFTSSSSPLTNFQGTVFKDENDLRRMIQDIREAINSELSEKQVDSMFSLYMGQLYNCDISDDNILPIDRTSKSNNENINAEKKEKPYISFLRELVNEFNSNGRRSVLYHADTVDKNNIDVLAAMGFIKVTKFKNGSVSVKPDGLGLQYVIDNPLN